MYKDIAKKETSKRKFTTLNKIKTSLVLGMNFPFVNIDTVLTVPLFNRKFSNGMMIVNHEMLKVPFSTVVKDKKWQKMLYHMRCIFVSMVGLKCNLANYILFYQKRQIMVVNLMK